MDWSTGFSGRYILYRVDPATWADVERLRFVSGTIDRTSDELRCSAQIDMTEVPGDGEEWVRIYLDARQEGGDPAQVPLFTGLTSMPERKISGTKETYTVDLYSALKPAADILMQRGWYAPVGISASTLLYDLLHIIAPVEIDSGAPQLASALIAEDDESNLTMANKIIEAIGWRMYVDGMGVIHIKQKDTAPVVTLDALTYDVIETEVTDKRDWYSCPNVLRAAKDDTVAVARDDDPDSPLSTVSRGREIWAQETDVTLQDGQSLAEYARTKLAELQSPARTLSYDRRFIDGVNVSDVIRIHYPASGIDGDYEITSQSIELGFSCRTSEEVKKI
jgi:hypothetical protein